MRADGGGVALYHTAGVGCVAHLPRRGRAGRAARVRYVAGGGRASHSGLRDPWRGAYERGDRNRLPQPHHQGANRAYQPERHRRGRGRRLLLRARSFKPAGLCHRGQYRDEFGRGALSEIRGNDQQPHGRYDGLDGWRGDRGRRRASGCGRAGPAWADLRL